ncbi:MAG: hypothetical protein AUH26_04660 [Candidatus Rokubacteria bacterium 13_1_40CM_69_96]|nr:MAG: hypothetical protein AUH26_04660 [Candidatus Rokubacteria bacterium 13_1_40CM_69_96]
MISIVGGGSWGTALAIHLAKNAGAVRLWAREPEVVEGIRVRRRSPWYLPDVDIPGGVAATTDAAEAVNGASVVVVAVPSEFFAATLKSVGPLSDAVPIVTATKGFDPERHVRMSEVVGEQFPRARVAALSGPTFAREVALGRPTAAVIASRDDGLAATLQRTLGSREFRLSSPRRRMPPRRSTARRSSSSPCRASSSPRRSRAWAPSPTRCRSSRRRRASIPSATCA